MTKLQQGATGVTVANAPANTSVFGKNEYFLAMGYSGSNYYFFVKAINSPVKLKAGQFKAKELIKIAPMEYWQATYPTNDRRNTFGVNWSVVAVELMGQCHNIGKFKGIPAPKDIPVLKWENTEASKHE